VVFLRDDRISAACGLTARLSDRNHKAAPFEALCAPIDGFDSADAGVMAEDPHRATSHGRIPGSWPARLVVQIAIHGQIGHLEVCERNDGFCATWFDRHPDDVVVLVEVLGSYQLQSRDIDSGSDNLLSRLRLPAARVVRCKPAGLVRAGTELDAHVRRDFAHDRVKGESQANDSWISVRIKCGLWK
jgi:hypothetical protein